MTTIDWIVLGAFFVLLFMVVWSLMGGFVRKDENLDDAAARILESLTGLQDIYLEQLSSYGEAGQGPGW